MSKAPVWMLRIIDAWPGEGTEGSQAVLGRADQDLMLLSSLSQRSFRATAFIFVV